MMTHRVFEALSDATRRVILDALVRGELSAGDVGRAIESHASISQPAISQHLKVLRDAKLVTVRAEGRKRIYTLNPVGVVAAQRWLEQLLASKAPFAQSLDALDTEIARGKRQRRRSTADGTRPTPSKRSVS